jgi:hypothetical protein
MGNVTTDVARTGDAVCNVNDDKTSIYNRNLIAAASDSFADLMRLIGLPRFDVDEVTA